MTQAVSSVGSFLSAHVFAWSGKKKKGEGGKKCEHFSTCTETRATAFVCACANVPCRDLVPEVCLSIRPAGPEEADGSSAEVSPRPFNISSPHSCPVQQSRVHRREDECAVSMPVGKKKQHYISIAPDHLLRVCNLFVYLGHCGAEQCASTAWIHLGPLSEGYTASF